MSEEITDFIYLDTAFFKQNRKKNSNHPKDRLIIFNISAIKLHLFYLSYLDKYLLKVYNVWGTVLGTEDIKVNTSSLCSQGAYLIS